MLQVIRIEQVEFDDKKKLPEDDGQLLVITIEYGKVKKTRMMIAGKNELMMLDALLDMYGYWLEEQ